MYRKYKLTVYTHLMNDVLRHNFSPQKQGVVHYTRYIFENI